MIQPAFEILNQRGTPMFFSDVLANRPTFGIIGRIFIATDSPYGLFRDTGTSWVQIAGSGGGGISGSGAAGQVTFWNGASSVSGSNNLWWDNATNKFLVGTNNTTGVGSAQITSSTGDSHLRVWGTDSPSIRIDNAVSAATQRFAMGLSTATNNFIQGSTAGDICITTASANPLLFGMWQTVNASQVGRITTANNWMIGSPTTDLGQRLQVYGDTYIRGTGATSATIALQVQNSAGTNNFRVANDGYTYTFTGSVIGSQNANIIQASDAINAQSASGLNLNILFGSFATAGYGLLVRGYNTSTRTATSGSSGTLSVEHGFAPTSGTGTFIMINASGTINQTGGANGITRGLYINPTITAAADWRSIEWSNNTGYGLLGLGTAPNTLFGSLSIGSTPVSGINLYIARNITGSVNSYGSYVTGTISTDVTNVAAYFQSYARTTAATFTLSSLYHFRAEQGSFGAGSVVNNQYGFFVHSTTTGATNNFAFYSDIASGTGRWNLYMNGTATNFLAGNLYIADSTIIAGNNYHFAKAITGATSLSAFINDGVVQSDVTTLMNNYNSTLRTAAASFNLSEYRHFIASQGTIGGGSSVTTQIGFYASSNMTGGTTNAGFVGDIGTAAGRYNLYMQGNAPNYLNGNLLLGSSTNPGQKLYVNGSIRIDGQTAATAGGSAGLHLIVNLDGTNYKIALLNV